MFEITDQQITDQQITHIYSPQGMQRHPRRTVAAHLILLEPQEALRRASQESEWHSHWPFPQTEPDWMDNSQKLKLDAAPIEHSAITTSCLLGKVLMTAMRSRLSERPAAIMAYLQELGHTKQLTSLLACGVSALLHGGMTDGLEYDGHWQKGELKHAWWELRRLEAALCELTKWPVPLRTPPLAPANQLSHIRMKHSSKSAELIISSQALQRLLTGDTSDGRNTLSGDWAKAACISLKPGWKHQDDTFQSIQENRQQELTAVKVSLCRVSEYSWELQAHWQDVTWKMEAEDSKVAQSCWLMPELIRQPTAEDEIQRLQRGSTSRWSPRVNAIKQLCLTNGNGYDWIYTPEGWILHMPYYPQSTASDQCMQRVEDLEGKINWPVDLTGFDPKWSALSALTGQAEGWSSLQEGPDGARSIRRDWAGVLLEACQIIWQDDANPKHRQTALKAANELEQYLGIKHRLTPENERKLPRNSIVVAEVIQQRENEPYQHKGSFDAHRWHALQQICLQLPPEGVEIDFDLVQSLGPNYYLLMKLNQANMAFRTAQKSGLQCQEPHPTVPSVHMYQIYQLMPSTGETVTLKATGKDGSFTRGARWRKHGSEIERTLAQYTLPEGDITIRALKEIDLTGTPLEP